MQFLETSLNFKKMRDWDVQIDLICIFMCLLFYVDFFQWNIREHFPKIYFSKLTVELIQYFVLHIYPLFLDSNFCCSTGINTLPRFCKRAAVMASDDQFLKSQMLKMLDQWKQDPIFFSMSVSVFTSVANSLDFFLMTWLGGGVILETPCFLEALD